MGKPTISGFIVGMILVSMVMVGLSVMFSQFNTVYAPADFDEGDMAVFNKLSELDTTMQETRAELNKIESDSSIFDIFGKFLTSAYASAKITLKSVDTFDAVARSGVDSIANAGGLDGSDSSANSLVDTVYTTIVTIISVLIFIGVIIAAIFKWGI